MCTVSQTGPGRCSLVHRSLYRIDVPDAVDEGTRTPGIDGSGKNSIFFAYSVGVLLAVDADTVLYLTLGWFKKTWAMNLAALALLLVTGNYIWEHQLYKEPVKTNAFEMNENITCLTNIIKSNEKNTWTICLRMMKRRWYMEMVILMRQSHF